MHALWLRCTTSAVLRSTTSAVFRQGRCLLCLLCLIWAIADKHCFQNVAPLLTVDQWGWAVADGMGAHCFQKLCQPSEKHKHEVLSTTCARHGLSTDGYGKFWKSEVSILPKGMHSAVGPNYCVAILALGCESR